MWKDATRIYSTWRSGESSGYCDLHRRGLKPAACSVDVRRNDAFELLCERPTKEVAGESRGSSLVLGFGADKESFDGSVVAIFEGTESREDCSGSSEEVEAHAGSQRFTRMSDQVVFNCVWLQANHRRPERWFRGRSKKGRSPQRG